MPLKWSRPVMSAGAGGHSAASQPRGLGDAGPRPRRCRRPGRCPDAARMGTAIADAVASAAALPTAKSAPGMREVLAIVGGDRSRRGCRPASTASAGPGHRRPGCTAGRRVASGPVARRRGPGVRARPGRRDGTWRSGRQQPDRARQRHLRTLARAVRASTVRAAGRGPARAGPAAGSCSRSPTPDAAAVISEHTDSIPTPGGNLALSWRRAQAVLAWLVQHGIDATRLQAVGHGAADPVAPNRPGGQPLNRRVVVIITP